MDNLNPRLLAFMLGEHRQVNVDSLIFHEHFFAGTKALNNQHREVMFNNICVYIHIIYSLPMVCTLVFLCLDRLGKSRDLKWSCNSNKPGNGFYFKSVITYKHGLQLQRRPFKRLLAW